MCKTGGCTVSPLCAARGLRSWRGSYVRLLGIPTGRCAVRNADDVALTGTSKVFHFSPDQNINDPKRQFRH